MIIGTVGWNDHNLYGGASIIRLSGTNTLSTTLISNGTTFPAGTSVSADIQLDWYRFGYEHRFTYNYSQASVLSFYPASVEMSRVNSSRDEDIDFQIDQFINKPWYPIYLPLGVTILNQNILAFGVTKLMQPIPKFNDDWIGNAVVGMILSEMYPIRETFAGCCGSARWVVARRKAVSSQRRGFGLDCNSDCPVSNLLLFWLIVNPSNCGPPHPGQTLPQLLLK